MLFFFNVSNYYSLIKRVGCLLRHTLPVHWDSGQVRPRTVLATGKTVVVVDVVEFCSTTTINNKYRFESFFA